MRKREHSHRRHRQPMTTDRNRCDADEEVVVGYRLRVYDADVSMKKLRLGRNGRGRHWLVLATEDWFDRSGWI
ncbi:hypothetical protein Ddye_007713 [Dipteronia dyeriana]|uniref:Uncharacterized protein n=1 Tax=Dipteronia dyeriana TaxID=168575 RepID=A0AAE0CRQ4_9ROSI|nr:hypothetical protein Ddye_007713 [Dipteronia dyeriana]